MKYHHIALSPSHLTPPHFDNAFAVVAGTHRVAGLECGGRANGGY